MKKVFAALLTSVMLTTSSIALPQLRITNDQGGLVYKYMDRAHKFAQTEGNVIIDGECTSSCLFYFVYVPHDRICVTRRAVLGFHAASHTHLDEKGVRHTDGVDVETTQMWIGMFPPQIKDWVINHHLMDTSAISFLSGPVLVDPNGLGIRRCK